MTASPARCAPGTGWTTRVKLKRQLEAARDRGEQITSTSVVFTEWLMNEWLPHYSGRNGTPISDRTRDSYERDLTKWAVPWFARTKLADIRRPTIKKWLAHLVASGLADNTARNVHTPVRAALGDAADDGLIAANPAAGVRVPKRVRIVEDDEQVKALTRKQLAALIEAMDPKHRLLVQFIAATGLRINEALAVRWMDLDLGRSPGVRVRQAVKKQSSEPFGPPKSQAGRRTVPIGGGLVNDLRLRRAESEWHRDEDLVFASTKGTPLSDGNLRRRVLTPAGKAAGVPWVGFHSLRHTAATLLFAEGRNVKHVQRWPGTRTRR